MRRDLGAFTYPGKIQFPQELLRAYVSPVGARSTWQSVTHQASRTACDQLLASWYAPGFCSM
jgi:hypothetical protein